jgi:hypothetical protein
MTHALDCAGSETTIPLGDFPPGHPLRYVWREFPLGDSPTTFNHSGETRRIALHPTPSRLNAEDLDLYPRYIELAEGSMPEAEFAAWLREHIVLDATRRVNESRARYAR